MEFEEVRKRFIKYFEGAKEGWRISEVLGISRERLMELGDVVANEFAKLALGKTTTGEFVANCLRYAENIEELVLIVTMCENALTYSRLQSMQFYEVVIEMYNFGKTMADIVTKNIVSSKDDMVM